MKIEAPPRPEELEVSLFGPGVGECVVVHLGAGEWVVVDSCIDRDTQAPAALEYLASQGVDVASSVKRVIVTHWHDDHIRGAARVVEAATSATFVCSMALRCEEFKQFVAASQSLNAQAAETSGVAEFGSILGILGQRQRDRARAHAVGPEWAAADKLIYRRTATHGAPDCELFALSPSAATLSRGLHEVARLLPKQGAPKRAAVSVEPNDTSLVLSVRLGAAVAILGSDLETGASAATGWGAVLTTTARPEAPAHVFKVPHHGSENAYLDTVWTTALASPDPVAVLTPFARGRKVLPTEQDIARMKRHTRHVYCTAPRPASGALQNAAVRRTVGEVALQFRARRAPMGHVRIRFSASMSAPTIELFGTAYAA